MCRSGQGGRYVVSASGYLPAGQASGNLYLNSILHVPTTTCQSIGTGIGFFFPTIGSWSKLATGIGVDDIDVAAGASIEVRMGIQKTPAGGSIQGYVDGVSVIYESVFGDSFEPLAGAGN